MANYPTPHINAAPEDFAQTVIMPGDPNRSRYIAENFLDNAVLVNNVRGIQGYTGEFMGKRVSVMASGMGVPSMCIYSYELFNVFGVENIIRVGTAGSVQPDIGLGTIVMAQGASTNSSYANMLDLGGGSFAPIASFKLLSTAVELARMNKLDYRVGNILTTDNFYNSNQIALDNWRRLGVVCIDMETSGLYFNAAQVGKQALTICTISDNVITGEGMSAQQRETSLHDMILLGLKTAINI